MNYFKKVFTDLWVSFSGMKVQEHFKYWLFPILMGLVFILSYYTGAPLLQELVAPRINRELGLLENSAHLILFLSAVILFRNLLQKQSARSRAVSLLFFLGVVFVFLEEIDYGLYWIELIKDIPENQHTITRNIHNSNVDVLHTIVFLGHLMVGALFIAVPIYFAQVQNKQWWFAGFIPFRKMVFTVLSIMLVGNIAAYFDGLNLPSNESLAGNRAEFDELVTYYTFLIYFLGIKTNREM